MRAVLASTIVIAACAPAPSAGIASLELRPDDPRAMTPRFDEGAAIETVASPSGLVAIHYTRAGRHAVPLADDDADDVPDYVAEVARAYDDALAFYREAGFRAPRSDEGAPEGDGGDARFDVYLVDFAGSSTGSFRRDQCESSVCSGHVVQENDFAGYGFASRADAIRILASHELFHAVQAAYDADQPAVLAEGSAVWATEAFAPETDDLERFSRGYLQATSRSLAQTVGGPVDAYGYGAGVFFLFLEERYGASLVRALVEDTEDGARGIAEPTWLEALDATLAREAGASFEAAWVEHAQWNLRTGRHADPALGYARGEGLAEIAPETIALPHRDDRVRMLRASARYYIAPTSGRDRIAVELVAPLDRASAREGVWVIAGTRERVVVARASEGMLAIDAPPSGEAVIAIVRALDDDGGSGRVPALCVGSPLEVEGCRAAIAGAVSDAGAAPDGGSEIAPSTSGCRAAPGSGGRWGVVLVMIALAIARWRRAWKEIPRNETARAIQDRAMHFGSATPRVGSAGDSR